MMAEHDQEVIRKGEEPREDAARPAQSPRRGVLASILALPWPVKLAGLAVIVVLVLVFMNLGNGPAPASQSGQPTPGPTALPGAATSPPAAAQQPAGTGLGYDSFPSSVIPADPAIPGSQPFNQSWAPQIDDSVDTGIILPVDGAASTLRHSTGVSMTVQAKTVDGLVVVSIDGKPFNEGESFDVKGVKGQVTQSSPPGERRIIFARGQGPVGLEVFAGGSGARFWYVENDGYDGIEIWATGGLGYKFKIEGRANPATEDGTYSASCDKEGIVLKGDRTTFGCLAGTKTSIVMWMPTSKQ